MLYVLMTVVCAFALLIGVPFTALKMGDELSMSWDVIGAMWLGVAFAVCVIGFVRYCISRYERYY